MPCESWRFLRRRSRGRCRHAEADWCDAGQPPGFLSFLPEEGEGEVDAFDLAEPPLGLCPCPAGQEVGLNLVEPGQHLRVDADHGASEAGVLMLARRRVRP